jgi:rhomboid family GlyGly-CTERM serine protease
VTKLQRLLSFHSAVAVFPAVLVAVLLAFHGLGAAAVPVLRYERSAVLSGEAWRLVTAHLVHADIVHLGWNVLGVLIVAFLFARDYPWRQWLVILGVSTATTDLGFLLLEPQLEWYVGFSGVLHGLMAAGLVAWFRTSRDAVTWIVTGLFAAKLAWEHFAGPLPFTAASLELPVVHEAHTYGAIGGGLAGLWLTRRMPRPASL